MAQFDGQPFRSWSFADKRAPKLELGREEREECEEREERGNDGDYVGGFERADIEGLLEKPVQFEQLRGLLDQAAARIARQG